MTSEVIHPVLSKETLDWARRLSFKVSRKFRCKAVREDLHAAALVALWRAIGNFRPEFGVQFKTHAYRRILWALQTWLRDTDHRSRLERRRERHGTPVPRQYNLSHWVGITEGPLEELLASRRDHGPAEVDCLDSFAHALQGLPIRLRLIARLYWIEDLTYLEIGRAVGCSESNVCLLMAKRIRPHLAERWRMDP